VCAAGGRWAFCWLGLFFFSPLLFSGDGARVIAGEHAMISGDRVPWNQPAWVLPARGHSSLAIAWEASMLSMATWRNRVLGMGLVGLALVAGHAQARDDEEKPKAAAAAPKAIIANLDLKDATLQGAWTIEGRELVSTMGEKPSDKPAAIRIGDMHTGEYVLTFKAKRTKGTGGLSIGFFAGDSRADALIEGWEDKISGISTIAGKAGNENETKKEQDLFVATKEGASETEWVPFTLRVDAKKIRLTSNGQPIFDWAGDRAQLASPSNLASDLGGIYLLVQNSSDQFRIKDLDLDAIEKPVAKKPGEPKPKRESGGRSADAGLELPASGSKWFGTRTPDQGGNPMQVDATVESVGEDELVLTTVDGGNATWEWKFARKGNKIELKRKRLVRAPNGAGRDVTTSNDRASGTISKDKISISYSWNVTYRKMKNQPVSGSMNLEPQ
jgi:hypothetical protein